MTCLLSRGILWKELLRQGWGRMDPVAGKVIADLGKELIKANNQNLRDMAQYLAKLAQDAGNQQTYLGRLGTLPAGAPVRFWLGNVDDEAVLRFEGLFKTAALGDAPVDARHRIGVRGPNVVILELINSGGLSYRADFVMDVEGAGRKIDLSAKGSDLPPLGLKRNYIWRFDGV